MTDADPLDKRRRDLYAVSIAILLYVLAGGSLTGSIGLSAGSIQIENKQVIVGAAWVAWAYFLWRYLLICKSPFAYFKNDINDNAHKSPFLRKIARREAARLCERLEFLARSGDQDRSRIDPALVSVNPAEFSTARNNAVEQSRAGRFPRAAGRRSLEWLELGAFVGNDGTASGIQLPSGYPGRWRIPWLYRLRMLPWPVLRAALTGDAFGNLVLPLLVAASAPIAALWAYGPW